MEVDEECSCQIVYICFGTGRCEGTILHRLLYQIICWEYVNEAIGLFLRVVLFTCVTILDKFICPFASPIKKSLYGRIHFVCTSMALVLMGINVSSCWRCGDYLDFE